MARYQSLTQSPLPAEIPQLVSVLALAPGSWGLVPLASVLAKRSTSQKLEIWVWHCALAVNGAIGMLPLVKQRVSLLSEASLRTDIYFHQMEKLVTYLCPRLKQTGCESSSFKGIIGKMPL